jgi:hypothetical protein
MARGVLHTASDGRTADSAGARYPDSLMELVNR